MVMDRLDEMIPSRAHALAIYLALQAAAETTIAFAPGVPEFGAHREYLGGAVIVDLLLAYGLYRGSRLAWTASVVLTVLGLLLYSIGMLAGSALLPKFVGVCLLMAAQITFLYSRHLRPTPAPAERATTVPYRDNATRSGL